MAAAANLHPDMLKHVRSQVEGPSAVGIVLRHLLLVFLITFVVLRFPDCIAATQNVPLFAIMFGIILTTLVVTAVKPPASLTKIVKRFGILLIVLLQVKKQLEGEVSAHLKESQLDFTGETVVIADGRGKLGSALTEKLLQLQADVIVGCPAASPSCFAAIEETRVSALTKLQADEEERVKTAAAGDSRESQASCRNPTPDGQCAAPTLAGSLTVLPLDLSDFASIRTFSDRVHELTESEKRVDYLICNGGRGQYFTEAEVTVQGWERSLGELYLGQHYLAKLLYDRLLAPLALTAQPAAAASLTAAVAVEEEDDPAARLTGAAHSAEVQLHEQSAAAFYKSPHVFASRVLFLGSFSYMAGDFDTSLLQGPGGLDFGVQGEVGGANGDLRGELTRNCGRTLGGLAPCCPLMPCPLTNGFARGSLAQLLEVSELQARVDRKAAANSEMVGTGRVLRRLVTAVVNTGFIDMGAPVTNGSLTYKGLRFMLDSILRGPDDSVRAVLYAMSSHNFVPGSYVDSMLVGHDHFGYGRSVRHTQALAYPSVRLLGFMKDKAVVAQEEQDGKDVSEGGGRGVKGSGQMLRSDENSVEDWLFRYRFGGVGRFVSNGRDVGLPGVAQRLWEAAEATIKDWEAKNPRK